MAKYIRINIGVAEDEDGAVIPTPVLEAVGGVMRAWLHDQGLEGSLDFIERDGQKIPSLRLLMPAGWGPEQVQAFAVRAGDQLKVILDGGVDAPDDPTADPAQPPG